MSVSKGSPASSSSSSSSDREKRMRGARMICSPYFVGAALILLSIVSMKYWTLSAQNDELVQRITSLQLQMKSDTFNLKSLQSSMTQKDVSLDECGKDKDNLQRTVEETKLSMKSRNEDFGNAQRERVKCDADLSKAREDFKKCRDDKATMAERATSNADDAEKHREAMEKKDSELLELNKQVKTLQGEVSSFQAKEAAETLKIKGVDGGGNPKPNLGPGELADVDPRGVHVREKAVQGMIFHKDANNQYLPLLPRGDPNLPRKKPRFSVAEMPKEDIFKKRNVKSEPGTSKKKPVKNESAGGEKVHDTAKEDDQKKDPKLKVKEVKEEEDMVADPKAGDDDEVIAAKPLDGKAGEVKEAKPRLKDDNPDAGEADDDKNREIEEDQDPNGDIEDFDAREVNHALEAKEKISEDEEAAFNNEQQQQQLPLPK